MSGKERRLRILMISQYFPPDHGGASTRIQNLIKALSAKNYDIDVISTVSHYPDGNELFLREKKLFRRNTSKSLSAIRIWMPRISHNSNLGRIVNYLWFTIIASISTLLVKKPNIIFAQSPNFFAWLPGLFGKLFHRTKLVLNIDDLWPEALEDLGVVKSSLIISFIKKIRKICFHLADHIVCISDAITHKIEKIGISKRKISTIEVGFDFSTTNIFDSRFPNVQNDTLTVVYSGILGPAYDFISVTTIAKQCEKLGLSVRFLIKGKGPEKNRIEKLVQASKLNNLSIVSKWMSTSDYTKFLGNADAFILPMKRNYISSTALPAKLFEYMAFKRPVIVIGKGEVANLIQAANCGVAVNYGNYSKVVEFIQYMIRNPISINEMGANGQSYIIKHLSISKIEEKFTKMIKSVVHSVKMNNESEKDVT